MSLSLNPWQSIRLSLGNVATSTVNSSRWRYRQEPDGNLRFRNPRAYKLVSVHVAKQMMMQELHTVVQSLFPKYQRLLEKQRREKVLKTQDSNWKNLIQAGEVQGSSWGSVPAKALDGDDYCFKAYDKIGRVRKEALMMYYDLDDDQHAITTTIKVWTGVNQEKYERTKGLFDVNASIKSTKSSCIDKEITTRRLCHIDISPNVTVSTGKNLIMTKVEGRDYSRKELVSNDDVIFQISGSVDSGLMDVYPTDAVKRLIQMSQYVGVVYVNHYIFSQFNVNRVIIQDFKLETQECMNIQPYSMTVVAIEPDEAVQFTEDTIKVVTEPIVVDKAKGWEGFILNNKLAEISAGIIESAASTGLGAIPDIGENII